MKTVTLHGKKAAGRVALIDDADFELVSPHRWCVLEQDFVERRTRGPYAITNVRRDGRYRTLLMHRLIMPGVVLIDHIDHDGLNNQRANLRPATRHQNQANALKNPGRSSRFKGVYWEESRASWKAQIGVDGVRRTLGRFPDELAAAAAYDLAALEVWGEYANLNLPAVGGT